MEFIGIYPSDKPMYKFYAVFASDNKIKSVYFGSAKHSDYTIHKDKNRRNRYIQRHLKDLRTNDPTRAGYLSMFILWNKPTLNASVNDYKRRYKKYLKTGEFN